MKRASRLWLAALAWLAACSAWAGASAPAQDGPPAAVLIPSPDDPADRLPDPASVSHPVLSEEQARFRTRALVFGAAAGMFAYGASVWWNDGASGHFRTINEGWFGQDTYAGGADKLGHAFSAYAGTRLLTKGFQWAGNDADLSLRLATATSLGVMLGMEVLDGFSKRYRFSKEDATMDILGAGLGYLMEKNRDLDRLLDFRLLYWPSSDARRQNEVDPVGDYSGQTYLMVVKASGMPALRRQTPLRYLELAVGYGSRGFEPNDGAPFPDRSRNLYVGLSLNLSEILGDTAFRGNRGSTAQKVTDTALEYIQVPGTAALVKHRL